MPQLQAAKKDLRKSARRRTINNRWRVAVHDAVQAVKKAIAENDKKTAEQAFLKSQKALDRASRRNIIHPNKAARQKSRLLKAIQKLN